MRRWDEDVEEHSRRRDLTWLLVLSALMLSFAFGVSYGRQDTAAVYEACSEALESASAALMAKTPAVLFYGQPRAPEPPCCPVEVNGG